MSEAWNLRNIYDVLVFGGRSYIRCAGAVCFVKLLLLCTWREMEGKIVGRIDHLGYSTKLDS
jgi:hypothetical protein